MRSSDSGHPTARRNSSVCHRLPDANTRVAPAQDRGPILPISKESVISSLAAAVPRRRRPTRGIAWGDDSRYRKDGPMRPRLGTTWISTQRLIAGRTAKEDSPDPKAARHFLALTSMPA